MPSGLQPSFLELPIRSSKPRRAGLTHVIDSGCTLFTTLDLLSSFAEFIDIWKFGWGTSYLDPALGPKLEALNQAGIKTCTGGTLLELSWLQRRTREFFEFASRAGFSCVEVSNGTVDMPAGTKQNLISRARDRGFEVMAEVGSKDVQKTMPPADWCEEADDDVDAGADWIIAEGRESGAAGLYDQSGDFRFSVLEALQQSPHASRIIYEAPRITQQAHLLKSQGHEANLGNVPIDKVLCLETLRLGMRADTLGDMLRSNPNRCDEYLRVRA